MKKAMTMITCLFITGMLMAQGNSGNKGNKAPATSSNNNNSNTEKDKSKDKKKNDKEANDKSMNDHDKKVWEGIGDNNCLKPSKNQPAKVTAAFQRDYPGAVNVRWTKCRGDWTASFNGILFRSTAVYHANGQRRDTRTPVVRDNIPRRILDIILKRDPQRRIEGAVKIEVPNVIKDIFRIKNISDGTPRYEYYDADGVTVSYNY